DLVGDPRAGVLVLQVDGGAKHDAVARVELGDIDDLGGRKQGLQLGNAALDEALLLARRMVFRVLLEVTVRARLGNGGNDAWPAGELQALELGPQPGGASLGDGCTIHVFNS